MGNRRATAGGILAVAALAFVAVPAAIAGGGGSTPPVTAPALAVPNTVDSPVAPPASTSAPVCAPRQLRVTGQDFKVALGTIVGTYRVETDGCSLAIDDRDLLTAIDGGVPPSGARLLAPGFVEITFPNPNVQAPPPVPPLPSLPGLTVPPITVPPLTVPPTTVPTTPLPALPNVPGLPPPLESTLNGARDTVSHTVSGVQGLLSPPTTTRPSPPPPPPPPDTGPAQYSSGATGFDISWPQCGGSYPPASSVAVVGVNDGRPFTTNPCLTSEYSWAGGARQLYINLNSPSDVDGTDSSGPAGQCGSNRDCMAYNYGYNAAAWSYTNAAGQGVRAKTWWLDVEMVGDCAPQFPTAGQGYWSCGQGLNAETVQGALDALRQRGLVAGIYSTSYQWGQITGGANPTGGGPPNWLAGASSSATGSWCSGSHDFAGGAPWLLQFSPQTWDRDQAC